MVADFSDNTVHALQFLDVVKMKDPTQKAHFYRNTLRDVLPFIPRVNIQLKIAYMKTSDIPYTNTQCSMLSRPHQHNIWSAWNLELEAPQNINMLYNNPNDIFIFMNS